MKIGIDIRNIGKGRTGDEVVFFNLVREFSLLDDKNQYLLLTDRTVEKDPRLQDEIKRLSLRSNFQVVSLGEEGINRFVWNFWSLPRFIRQEGLDIYHTQYIVPFFVPRKTKIVTIVHDVSFRAYPEMIKFLDRLFLGILIPISLKRADLVLGVSRFTSQEIERFYHLPEKKIGWIHNAVSEELAAQEESAGEEIRLREKYSLPQKFIFYLGTLQPRKNLPMLIRSFSRLAEKDPELRLVLAGGRGYNFDGVIDEVVQKLGIEDKVFFPGFISDTDKMHLFRMATVFCFPSLYEGFGIPILESFAAGTPVVASRIPPHIEVAGEAALLFDIRKPESLDKNLKEALYDEAARQRLRERGRERLKEFSWQKTAEKMLEYYQKLAG